LKLQLIKSHVPEIDLQESGHGRFDLSGGPDCHHSGDTVFLRLAMRSEPMTFETPVAAEPLEAGSDDRWGLQWTPIIAGALAASALSLILITFAATVGLGVSSTSPTWRDASVALWLLSGIYLVLQSLISFGCGGYVAGRTRAPYASAGTDEVETRDGLNGVASWALAVLIGVILAALVGLAARPSSTTAPATATEPSVLSYEIDHLFRSARRPPNVDLAPERAEAGRILLTSSSHNGVSAEDRGYLIQQVTIVAGLSAADAERRVDTVIADSKKAISRTRASSVILAFSVATALLLGAVAAWAGAAAGGRHRDGTPLSNWMVHANRLHRTRTVSRSLGIGVN
jgi:hypothetical protein